MTSHCPHTWARSRTEGGGAPGGGGGQLDHRGVPKIGARPLGGHLITGGVTKTRGVILTKKEVKRFFGHLRRPKISWQGEGVPHRRGWGSPKFSLSSPGAPLPSTPLPVPMYDCPYFSNAKNTFFTE